MGGKKRRVDGGEGTAVAHTASADSDSDAADDSEDEGVDAHGATTSDQSQVCEAAAFALGYSFGVCQSLQCVRFFLSSRAQLEHSLTSLPQTASEVQCLGPMAAPHVLSCHCPRTVCR